MFLHNFSLKLGNFFKTCLIISIYSCLIIACSDNKIELLNGLSQDAANNVILTLGNHDIDSSKNVQKDGTYIIHVPSLQKLKALNILKDNGLPEHDFTNLGTIFKKDSFISSPLEEHSRFLYALNQEISSLLSSLNGIIDVKTIVNLPAPNDNLWQSQAPVASASVLIKYQQGERIDLYINRIKTLVANAVPGLTIDHVEVITLMQKDNEYVR